MGQRAFPTDERPPMDEMVPAAGHRMAGHADAPADQSQVSETFGLEACLEQFVDSAPVKQPQELLAFLPPGATSVRRMALVELIKLDMSVRAEQGCLQRIECYLAELTDWLTVEQVPLDLVLEELQLRREAGETPPRQEYAERFPQLAGLLGQLPLHDEVSVALDRRPSTGELAIGEQIDDFTILRRLGSGAFARVYLARQESMQRLVALKVSQRSGDEPQALAKLQHPNIVHVYDQRQSLDPPAHLLYMQYVPGGTLSDVIRWAQTRLPEHRDGSAVLRAVDENLLAAEQPAPENSTVRRWLSDAEWASTVAWVGVQLARALHYAHRQNILHRDVKPANVLMSAEAIPKLADFNVSTAGLSGRAGAAAFFGGSLGYMSPEQLRAADPADGTEAADLDGRSDLYSLSIVLWELWQGHRPWDPGELPSSWTEAIAVQSQIRQSMIPPVDCVGGPACRVLDRVLRQTLQLDAGDRPASGAELAGRLRLALHPEAASLFEPAQYSAAGMLGRRSVLLLAATAIMLPNIAAGIFNFFYNQFFIIEKYHAMEPVFHQLATWVNSIAYPLAIVLLLWYLTPLRKGMKQSRGGQAVDQQTICATWDIGFHAAVIAASLWAVAGIVYPFVLKFMFPEFQAAHCIHFFVSLVLCGLVAWTYPFFGLTTLSVLVYYPQMMQASMHDPGFETRATKLSRRCGRFLLAAVGIPLLAAALLISDSTDSAVSATEPPVEGALASEVTSPAATTSTVTRDANRKARYDAASRNTLRFALLATAAGLAASFAAFQLIQRRLDQLGVVLSPDRPSPIPMPGEEW